jgi:hypothetical protein
MPLPLVSPLPSAGSPASACSGPGAVAMACSSLRRALLAAGCWRPGTPPPLLLLLLMMGLLRRGGVAGPGDASDNGPPGACAAMLLSPAPVPRGPAAAAAAAAATAAAATPSAAQPTGCLQAATGSRTKGLTRARRCCTHLSACATMPCGLALASSRRAATADPVVGLLHRRNAQHTQRQPAGHVRAPGQSAHLHKPPHAKLDGGAREVLGDLEVIRVQPAACVCVVCVCVSVCVWCVCVVCVQGRR